MKRRRRIDDFSKWKIEQLGKFGGFSHRYIASLIFEKSLNRVTMNEIHTISYHLHASKVKVTDWRNGRTPQSAEYAKNKAKPKRKRFKLLVAA